MSNSNNIPTFNDICGTVTEALAETIINREAIIVKLRDENDRLYKTNTELRKQVEGWRDECEALEKDEKELYRVRPALVVAENAVRDLDAQCKTLYFQNETLKKELAFLKQDFGRGDAYWLAVTERDDARRRYCELVHNLEGTKPEKIAKFNGWDDLYVIDNTPSLFEQKSDTDPATGVQYGDLSY